MTISMYAPNEPSSKPVFDISDTKVKQAVNYVATKMEATVSPEMRSLVGTAAATLKTGGKFPKHAQKFVSIEAFQIHQEGISRSPVSYLLGKQDQDGTSFSLKRRVFDIVIGSTMAGLGELTGQIALIALNLAKVVVNGVKAISEKMKSGSVKEATKANLSKAAKNTAKAFGSAVREAVRSVPLAGHFLAKAADTIALMGQDLAAAAVAKAHSYSKVPTGTVDA